MRLGVRGLPRVGAHVDFDRTRVDDVEGRARLPLLYHQMVLPHHLVCHVPAQLAMLLHIQVAEELHAGGRTHDHLEFFIRAQVGRFREHA